jgi:hypothetical protein
MEGMEDVERILRERLRRKSEVGLRSSAPFA